MAATPPSAPTPAGDDRNLVAVDATNAVTSEEKMQVFWEKNRKLVIALCVLVLLGILAKGGWDFMARRKDRDVQSAYAAATTDEQLKTFAAAHGDHPLGGIAQMRVADEAYAAGKSADAVAAYDKAMGVLKTGPLASRARVGRALSKAQAGNAAEATNELKQIADDTNQSEAARAEAAYHLTSLAVEAGNAAEAQKYVDLLNQIEPMGAWAQRALSLRATLPVTAPAPAPAATPQPPGAGTESEKKADASMEVKLPGTGK